MKRVALARALALIAATAALALPAASASAATGPPTLELNAPKTPALLDKVTATGTLPGATGGEQVTVLVEASGNEPLAEVYRSLNANVRRARYMANYSRERWDAAASEHEEMLRALVKRDGAALQRILREHLANKLVLVMEALGEKGEAP